MFGAAVRAWKFPSPSVFYSNSRQVRGGLDAVGISIEGKPRFSDAPSASVIGWVELATATLKDRVAETGSWCLIRSKLGAVHSVGYAIDEPFVYGRFN